MSIEIIVIDHQKIGVFLLIEIKTTMHNNKYGKKGRKVSFSGFNI